VRKARLGVLLAGLILVLAACGRVPPTSSATTTPTPNASPAAAPTPLTIPGPTLSPGEVGLAYSPVTIQATGGDKPFLWRVSDGALPAGLSISQDGAISGTPTAAGTFAFSLEVMDASKATANVSGAIHIVPKLTVSPIQSGTTTIRKGSGASGSLFATQSGGAGPFGYTVTSGLVPTGTSLSGLSLTGTFSSTGNYSFTVTVTDGLGATATVGRVYDIWGAIAFPPYNYPGGGPPPAGHIWSYSDATCGSLTTGCSTRYSYSGGTPGVTPTVSYSTEECVPLGCTVKPLNGLSVTVSGGYVHVSVAANVNPGRTYGATVVVWLTDPRTHEVTRLAYFACSA